MIRFASLAAVLLAGPVFAQGGSLSICGDLSAAATDVAHHCRRALEQGGLTTDQEVAVRVNLGDAFLAIGQSDRAVEALTGALAVDASRPEIYIGRAAAWEARGDRTRAERDWNDALRLAPESVDVRIGRGAFFLRGAAAGRAVEEFTVALQLDAEATDALYNRAIALLALGRADAAEGDLTRLIALEPNDAGAYYHRGRTRIGRSDRGALADFDQAAALAPSWAAPWYQAGRLLDRIGRRDEANRKLRRAFELGFQDPWLLRRIQSLGG